MIIEEEVVADFDCEFHSFLVQSNNSYCKLAYSVHF